MDIFESLSYPAWECKLVNRDQCVDNCVNDIVEDPYRSWYQVFNWNAANCQAWAEGVFSLCRANCNGKEFWTDS
jgi:hypothetical protein